MSRLLYEKSVSYKGYLIIPFVLGTVNGQVMYSYRLLSELGHKGKLHKAENPTGICSNSIDSIIDIAKEYLDKKSDIRSRVDYFKQRYIYHNNLIIINEGAGKYFYDHYNADTLNNIAAPKLFESEQDCIDWIRQRLERSLIDRGAESDLAGYLESY